MNDESYREAAWRLIEWGRKRAEVEAADRDQLVWDAHQQGMGKAEIARLTSLSWATVDRTVRDMAAKQDGTDAGETKTAEAVESGPQTAKQDSGGEG